MPLSAPAGGGADPWDNSGQWAASPASCPSARRPPTLTVRAARGPDPRSGLLADDHCRILLKAESSHSGSDYINASPVVSARPCGGWGARGAARPCCQ